MQSTIPYRTLGRTGERVSAIGLGGWHLGLERVDGQRAGKIRYIGFTGHKDPHIHLYMLDVAREHGFLFDTVQMPLNVMDAHYRSFGTLVLPELVKQGTGVLGKI